ncbi:hypothetical protein NWFMUON74_09880 [Nocardia wallacei]|uniref:Major facilitator superfamily (MFS) profile domain-containing protein n=3 Tax=Nocardia wallacei TaxID=480035 RepID=A0A7G1KF79_9NOCA|nr:hypothetical protein NWFMUON74_09880 [Nocardia wallacei]
MQKTGTARHPGAILGVMAFAGIVASLTQTLVVPLLGQMPQLLHTSASNATWVVTASLLAGAVTTPVAGRLGDLLGKRRVLLASVVPLVVGSVICAVASSLWPMIIGRVLQGMCVGLIPVGIAALRDLLPPERLGSGIALISSSLGIGGALGLPLAAAVIEYSNWRVLFWGVAVLAALVGLLIFTVIPATPPNTARGRFDFLGAIGLGAALICLLLAISKGASWGWTSGLTIGLFAAAVVVLLLWGLWELRSRDPLVDLRVTARPQVLLTNAASIVVGMAMYAQSLIVPQLLQLPESTGYGLGQSMMAMGLWMAPAGLMMMAVSPFGARLSALSGPKITLIVGCIIIAAGYGSSMGLMGTTWGLLVVTLIINVGVGFAYGAMPALVMGAVPQSETAAANSFNTLMRSIGTSTAAAVVGAVLAQMSVTLAGHSIPTENGFRAGLLIGCGVAAAGAVVALFIPARRSERAAPAPAGPRHALDDDRELVHAAVGALDPAGGADAMRQSGGGATQYDGVAAGQPNGVAARHGTAGSPAVSGPVLYGRMLDSRGVAVAGATLTLISSSGQQLGRAQSRADGYYELSAPAAGSYVLIASAEGRRPDASTVTLADRPVSCDVTLAAMAGLAGTVARAGDNAPVAEAQVSALDLRGEVLASAVTDPEGRFGLTELPEGEFTVAVSALGFHPTALAVRVAGSGVTSLDVLLRPGIRLHGVVRVHDGRPIEDARVTLADARGNVVDTMTTGPDGSYSFGNLDEGSYTVVATGYGPTTTRVSVRGGDLDDVDLELGHGSPERSAVAVAERNGYSGEARDN